MPAAAHVIAPQTIVDGRPAWRARFRHCGDEPSPDIQIVQHGLEIRVGSVKVPGPRSHDDESAEPAREFTFPVVLEPVRLLVGLGITAALAAIPYEFCSDGNAHGLPFAIVHPHRSEMPALGIQLPVPGEQEWVFDLLNLARGWLLWSAVTFGRRVGSQT